MGEPLTNAERQHRYQAKIKAELTFLREYARVASLTIDGLTAILSGLIEQRASEDAR
jgi:hypothetical protein